MKDLKIWIIILLVIVLITSIVFNPRKVIIEKEIGKVERLQLQADNANLKRHIATITNKVVRDSSRWADAAITYQRALARAHQNVKNSPSLVTASPLAIDSIGRVLYPTVATDSLYTGNLARVRSAFGDALRARAQEGVIAVQAARVDSLTVQAATIHADLSTVIKDQNEELKNKDREIEIADEATALTEKENKKLTSKNKLLKVIGVVGTVGGLLVGLLL